MASIQPYLFLVLFSLQPDCYFSNDGQEAIQKLALFQEGVAYA